MVVLDTSYLLALERNDLGAWLRMARLQESGAILRVPAAVWVEYLFPMAAPKRTRAVEELEAAIVFEPFTREVADAASRLQHALKARGAALGWHDLQIAATALHYNEAVVTMDKAFAGVPDLHVVERRPETKADEGRRRRAGVDDAQFQAFLNSGNERPVIWTLRAQRVASVLALLLFLLWLAATNDAPVLRSAERALGWSFAVVLAAALGLRIAVFVLDRRAMRKDMALLQEREP